jgi:uncharacterized membrane protein HdeD (DUF308 family)
MIMETKLLRNLATFIAGGWLLLSPWVMNYHHLSYAAWSAVIGGTILMLAEFMAFVRPGVWEELLDIFLGTYLFSSPFILGFAATAAVADNAHMIGFLVIVFGVLGLMDEANVQRWWHDHMHHSRWLNP